jgi:ATP-dependent Clp protease ATP-binding subunit ClpB
MDNYTKDADLSTLAGYKPLHPRSPAWLRDIAQFFAIRSQFVITGNINDLTLIPTQTVLVPMGLKDTIAALLEVFGYDFLLCYDPFDKFQLHAPTQQTISLANNVTGLNIDSTGHAEHSSKKLLDVMKQLVHSQQNGVLLIEHAARFTEEDGNAVFGQALKLSKTAQQRQMKDGKVRFNPIFWIVENENSLPPWLMLQNERIRLQSIPKPDREARMQAISVLCPGISGYDDTEEDERKQIINAFARSTEGFTISSLVSTTQLARDRAETFLRILDVVRLYKMGITETPWDDPYLYEVINTAEPELEKRVIGQRQAIVKTIDTLKRSVMGLSGAWASPDTAFSTQPKGVLFFAGPTGVGKTELAKAITSLLFGDERAYIRFDMSEFAQEQNEARLIGAAPGFIGHEAGGELTRAIRERPFSVVLFDEIEKAHPRILDKFLQILQDGRLTDSHGETVYFSESIIVFTSNLGIYKEDSSGEKTANVDTSMKYEEIEHRVITEIESYFKFKLNRPEILNRLGDNIVVFNFISADVAEKIFERQLSNIQKRANKQHNLTLNISDDVYEKLIELCTNDLANGGRGIGNRLETVFVNPLSRALFDFKPSSRESVKVTNLTLNDGIYSLTLSC